MTTYTEFGLHPDILTETISCESDKHHFVWFSNDEEPKTCVCRQIENLKDDDRIMHTRLTRTVYGRFDIVPLTKNQESPYFVHEWDIAE